MSAIAVPKFKVAEAANTRADEAMAAAPAMRLRAVDVHELARMPFKVRAVILDPWLHSQDLCMVFAARGIGKTHFGIAIAFAVATGGSFLHWRAPKPAKVLYLDGELPGNVMQRRLLMHSPDAGPAPGFLRVFTPDMPEMDGRALPDVATIAGQAEIDAMIHDDTALVVVDNLSAWARTGRENEAESWHPIADWVLRLRRRGIAVILIHHGGKNGEQRGTSKKEDLLDVVIKLSRPANYDPKKGAVFVAEFTKARNLAGDAADSLEISLEGDETRAEWRCTTVEASTYERVIYLANEGSQPNDIAAELGVNKSTVSRHLRRGREAGSIRTQQCDRNARA
jgi:putative DNA primase/helicase